MAVRQQAYQAPLRLKPPLLSVGDAERLDAETMARLFSTHFGPGQLGWIKMLGLHRLAVERAEGPYIFTRDGRRILDLFSGSGALALGHNHPSIVEARRRCLEERPDGIPALLARYSAALAHNLASIAPGDLDMVALGCTGGEVMQTAIELAQRAQGPARSRVLHADDVLARRTDAAPGERGVRVPFGDIAAIEAAIDFDSAIGVVVSETIQSSGVIEAPDGFWLELRALCDRHGLLWVADETACGLGRTGRFFAFEHEGVTPDVTVLAKSLGGGPSALAAMIARRPVHNRACSQGGAMPLAGTAVLDGMGEACCTAIEALHVLYDERLMENAARQGDYLVGRLREIAGRYPHLVRHVRGRGLMVGLEFHDLGQALPFGLRQAVSALEGKLRASLGAFVGSMLLHDYDVLVGPAEDSGNLIRLEPPLIIGREHVDCFADALDDLLSRGIVRMLADFLRLQSANDSRP